MGHHSQHLPQLNQPHFYLLQNLATRKLSYFVQRVLRSLKGHKSFKESQKSQRVTFCYALSVSVTWSQEEQQEPPVHRLWEADKKVYLPPHSDQARIGGF